MDTFGGFLPPTHLPHAKVQVGLVLLLTAQLERASVQDSAVEPRLLGHLRRCSRRRVSEFASKNEKGLAVNHKLRSAVLSTKVWQIRSECRAKLTQDDTQYKKNRSMCHFLNSCRS